MAADQMEWTQNLFLTFSPIMTQRFRLLLFGAMPLLAGCYVAELYHRRAIHPDGLRSVQPGMTSPQQVSRGGSLLTGYGLCTPVFQFIPTVFCDTSAAAYSSSGETLAIANYSAYHVSLQLFDSASKRLLWSRHQFNTAISAIAFSKDDRTVHAASGNTLYILSRETGSIQATHAIRRAHTIATSEKAIFIGHNGSLTMIKADGTQTEQSCVPDREILTSGISRAPAEIVDIAVSEDEQSMAAIDIRGFVCEFDLNDGMRLKAAYYPHRPTFMGQVAYRNGLYIAREQQVSQVKETEHVYECTQSLEEIHVTPQAFYGLVRNFDRGGGYPIVDIDSFIERRCKAVGGG